MMSNLVLVSMFKEVLGWCQWNDPNGTWEDVKLTFDNIKNVYDTLVEWHNDAPEVKYIDVLKEKLRYIAINLQVGEEESEEEEDSDDEYNGNMYCDNYGICSGADCSNHYNCK